MSILSKLKAKTVEWKPLEDVSIQVPALSVGDGLDEMVTLQMSEDPKEIAKAVSVILNKTLRKAVPDATDEELDDLGLEHMTSLMDVIKEANNLKDDEDASAKFQKLKEMQEEYKNRRKKKE